MNTLHNAIMKAVDSGNLRKGAKVLDAGAGSGDVSGMLSGLGLSVTSCDIDPSGFRNGRCVKVDLNDDLPFRKSSFDCVVSSEVVEHIENPRHLLREFSRMLRRDGLLVISTPNTANIFSRLKFLLTGKFFCFGEAERSDGHVTPVTWWQMEDCMKAAGFRIVAIKSNEHLRIGGRSNAGNSAKRVLSRLALILLYPLLSPKHREILTGDSLIFIARKL